MGKQKRYPVELQQQLIRLVHAGRSAKELSREFEPRSRRSGSLRHTELAAQLSGRVAAVVTVAGSVRSE